MASHLDNSAASARVSGNVATLAGSAKVGGGISQYILGELI
nr:hypothetical protein [Bradyrhizobium diazoefficiens]